MEAIIDIVEDIAAAEQRILFISLILITIKEQFIIRNTIKNSFLQGMSECNSGMIVMGVNNYPLIRLQFCLSKRKACLLLQIWSRTRELTSHRMNNSTVIQLHIFKVSL